MVGVYIFSVVLAAGIPAVLAEIADYILAARRVK